MKKLLIVLLVAVLALALVACGGNTETTPDEGADTTPAGTTTKDNGGDVTPPADSTPDNGGDVTPPADSSTEDNGGNDVPEYYDLILDPEFMALNAAWNSVDFYTFEDFHGALDNHIAMVLQFNDVAGVWTDLFLDTTTEGATPYPNDEYDWVVTLDGKDYPVDRFSLFNNGTSGYARCDLGAEIKWSDFEWDENDQHAFKAELKIYDSSKTLYYYADLNYYGDTYFTKPEEMVMVADPDRPSNTVQISVGQLEAISGPDAGNGEGFQKLFDGKVGTKICTGNDNDDGAVVVKINANYTVVGISIVNANDNKGYGGRTLLAFDIYGSNDAEEWTSVYTATGVDAEGTALDKGLYNTNFGENYYAFEIGAEYSYYKLVPHNGETWQASELMFWTEE